MIAYAMGDSLFPTPNGRLPNPNQAWTPQSAVSSFNLPAEYNMDLTTPVSRSVETPTINDRAPALSPWPQNNLNGMHYAKDASSVSNTSMKSKNFSQSIHVSETSLNPSLSPYIFESPQSAYPHTPYTNDYSISGHPDNNPSMTPPTTASAHSSKQNSISQPPLSAGSLNQAPILGNPTPEALRPQKRLHDSISPQTSQPMQQHSMRNEQEKIPQSERRSQSRRTSIFIQEESPPFKQPSKRLRTSSADSSAIIQLPGGAQLISDRLTEEERSLFRLRDEVREDGKKRSWTETMEIFNDTFGKQDKVPALQMKYFRAKDKCRDWTETDTQALDSAMKSYVKKKWHFIAQEMVKHGSEMKWHPVTCQRKYAELHPESEEGKAETEHVAIQAANDTEFNAEYNESESFDNLAVEDDDDRLSPQSRRGSNSTKTRRRRPKKRDSERSAATSASASTPLYEKQQIWMVQPQHVTLPAVTVSMTQEGDLAAYAPYSSAP